MITALFLSRLAYSELLRREEANYRPNRFDPGRILLGVKFRMIGQPNCRHQWETVHRPENRWLCPQSGGQIIVAAETDPCCYKCGAKESYLRIQRKKHPDLFPWQDKRGRWHAPTLWPLFLRRWLFAQFHRLISNESRNQQVAPN